ncbi:hypothetical protein NUW54_g5638 [Trametes sanguinea]|uniref:Uncharacterized protein n=1 Tax=Trametes sanguinea TaxID=158606 RepID=A0ACC1PUK4_9APHY|nr:hypothetical protein NUW54_g5638 [Trametes sanguinea]
MVYTAFPQFNLHPSVRFADYFLFAITCDSKAAAWVSEALYILFLFTKSDILTVLLPSLTFSTIAAGDLCATHIVGRLLWIWLNLLQFCVSNQTVSMAEDELNKPWRPLPAGHLTIGNARRLRWMLIPLSLMVSKGVGRLTLQCSAALVLATLAHNELFLGSHWLSRNALNAIGYVAFNMGATSISCRQATATSSPHQLVHFFNSAVIFTTIHAQDFKDIHGDRNIGRLTLPLAYPVASRLIVAVAVPIWSLWLAYHWQSAAVFRAVFLLFGSYVGARFGAWRTVNEDRASYRAYNVSE